MSFVFVLFTRSDHLGPCFLYSYQSTWDFMEYILFDFSAFEQEDYGKIALEAAWYASRFMIGSVSGVNGAN